LPTTPARQLSSLASVSAAAFHPCWLSNFTPSAPLTDTGLKAPKLPTHSSHLDTTRIQYDRLSGRTDDDCRTKHTKPGTADWSLTLHAI
ncbi:hypothetical protein K456DRAFT_1761241, partial [Colletotrichum gloeosporioides 23]